MVDQVINFLTEFKARGDIFLEGKPRLHYYCFSYFAHFQGARDLGKSDLWRSSGSFQAQPRCSRVCSQLCLWPGSLLTEVPRCFCSMQNGTLCPKIKPCKETLPPSYEMQRAAGCWCCCSPAPALHPSSLISLHMQCLPGQVTGATRLLDPRSPPITGVQVDEGGRTTCLPFLSIAQKGGCDVASSSSPVVGAAAFLDRHSSLASSVEDQ